MHAFGNNSPQSIALKLALLHPYIKENAGFHQGR
jgi:hypothetical protein